jgi:SAM-dependent methyltransferase
LSGLISDLSHLERLGGSIADDVGRVLHSEGRILRAIHPGKDGAVRALLASGLVDDLVAQGLFPRTSVTDLSSPEFPLVLEHERLENVSYPCEWSFSMFRDAALMVLRVNETANRYGYELKDCHAMNVIFSPGGPQYVDLGSFTPWTDPARGWVGADEFVRYYLYTLAIWRTGNEAIARKLLNDTTSGLLHREFALYQSPLLRALPLSVTDNLLMAARLFRELRLTSDDRIRTRLPGPLASLLCFLKRTNLLPCRPLTNDQLARRVRSHEKKAPSRPPRVIPGSGHPAAATPQRDARVMAVIESLKPASVLDLAGGDGQRAAEIAKLPGVRTVICNDLNDHAIDRCHERNREAGHTVLPTVIDFMRPMQQCFTPLPAERLASDVVIALDLTYPMLFVRALHVDAVLRAIGAFANHDVLVEFVPLGPHAPSDGAGWYHRDWFEGHFRAIFDGVRVEVLEGGRVLFVGRKRPAEQVG